MDSILNHLSEGTFQFEVPKAMNRDETYTVHAYLHGTVISVSTGSPGSPIQVITADVKISDEMDAMLESEGFEIKPEGHVTQWITSGVTEWQWDIKPTAIGPQQLTLTLDDILTIDGKTEPRIEKAFERTVNVQVTPGQHFGDFVKGHGEWLWGVLGIPALPVLWNNRRKIFGKARRKLHSRV